MFAAASKASLWYVPDYVVLKVGEEGKAGGMPPYDKEFHIQPQSACKEDPQARISFGNGINGIRVLLQERQNLLPEKVDFVKKDHGQDEKGRADGCPPQAQGKGERSLGGEPAPEKGQAAKKENRNRKKKSFQVVSYVSRASEKGAAFSKGRGAFGAYTLPMSRSSHERSICFIRMKYSGIWHGASMVCSTTLAGHVSRVGSGIGR